LGAAFKTLETYKRGSAFFWPLSSRKRS